MEKAVQFLPIFLRDVSKYYSILISKATPLNE